MYSVEQAEWFISANQDIILSGVTTIQNMNAASNEFIIQRHEMLSSQIIQTATIIGVMIVLFEIFLVEISKTFRNLYYYSRSFNLTFIGVILTNDRSLDYVYATDDLLVK
jgi:hypothetical protein